MFTPAIFQYVLFWLVMSGILFIVPDLGLGIKAAADYSNILQILASISCLLLCLRTMAVFPRDDPMRLAWGLIGAGVLSWGIGQSLYAGYGIVNNGTEPPYIWFSDIGFLMTQPLITAALLIFARALATPPPLWGIITSLLVFFIAAGLAFNGAIDNLKDASSLIEKLAVLAYVLFDPMLLAVTIFSASLLTGGLLARPWWVCFSGLVLYFTSNRLFEMQSAQESYVSGSWVDLGWVLSFMLIGVASMMAYDMLQPED